MLGLMRGHVVLRLLTILTILTFFPSSAGAWTLMDQTRVVVVRADDEFGRLAELPWETVEQLESGVGNMPWKEDGRFQLAANTTDAPSARPASSFQLDDKSGALFATHETSPMDGFLVADARAEIEDAISDSLRDEVLAEIEPITIPEDLIEQAIRETQDRIVVAQAEQTEDDLSSVAAQLEQEVDAILDTEAEEPKASEEVERFILAQAETGDPFAGSTTSGPELLLLAQDNLGNNLPADAALNCIELIDRFPRTLYAVGGNTILDGMANAFRKGNYSAQDVAAFEAAMPSFGQLQSVDGKYNAMMFHRIKAELAAQEGRTADGRALLEMCIAESQTLMEMDPTSPLQIDIMKVFMYSAREYSGVEAKAAADYLKYYLDTQPNSVGRWSAMYVLKKYEGNLGEDIGSSRLRAVDILHYALNDSYVADAIADPTCYDGMKGALQYAIADAYMTRNRWQDAMDKCNEIITKYPSASQSVHAAAYLKAYITQRTESDDSYAVIVAYNDVYQNYPDAVQAKKALWMVGNLYFHVEDYTQAATYYRDVITQYPGSGVAIAAADTIDYMNAYLVGSQEAVAEGPKKPEPWMVAQMCGPLALQKLLTLNGVNVELKDLAERSGVNNQGTTMLALVETARHYGVTLTGIQLASLESLQSPFIAYVNNDHFVLVKDVDQQQLTIADSWKEDEIVLAQDFEKTWNGSALVVGPGPKTAARLELASLAAFYGGNSEEDDGEIEGCGQNNHTPPVCASPSCKNCEQSDSQSLIPGGSSGEPTDAPGGHLVTPPFMTGIAGSPQSGQGYQGLNTGITSPGINARIDAYTSALSLNEVDLFLDVDGPMSITFHRNFFARRGYMLGYRKLEKWYSNNIGSGWYHNYNVRIRASDATEAQGQPSTLSFYDEVGNADEYEFSQRLTAWGLDLYLPNSNSVNTQDLGNQILRGITTGTYIFTKGSKLQLHFSVVDSNQDARLESVLDAEANKITLSYDAAVGTGKLTKIDTPSGDTRYIQLSYSGFQMTKAEIKKGSTVLQTVSYAYNSSKELTKVTDDAGEDIQYAYDTDATYTTSRVITKITDKLGFDYDFTYTFKTRPAGGAQTYVIDIVHPNGLKTTFDRSNTSGSLNVVTVINYDGTTALNKTIYRPDAVGYRHGKIDFYTDASFYDRWEMTYTSDRDLVTIKRPGGVAFAAYVYNSKGRMLAHSGEDLAVAWQFSSGNQWNPTKRVEADGTETDYLLNAKNMLTKTTHPSYAAAGWRYAYDAEGNATKVTSPGGEDTTIAYNAHGNVSSRTNPLSHVTTFAYDDLGRRTKVTDPLSNDTEFFYADGGCGGCGGSAGQLTKIKDAEANETKFEFDLGGRRTKSIDPRGIATAFAYDKENRVTKITSPSGSANTTTVAYDKLGRQTKATDFEGNDSTLYYDYKNRMTKQTDPIGDTVFTYDDFGNMSTLTDAESQKWIWTYDSDNRLSWTRDDELKTVNYRYDAEGRMTKTYANLILGTVDPTLYSFNDTTGRMTKVEYVSGANTHDATYNYDDEGQVTKVADWLESGGNARLYAFDDSGRLTKITEPDLNNITYSYDSAGRVTSINDYQSKVTSYTYTDSGRLSTITAPGSKTWDYDYEDGFVTKYTHPNGMTTNYEYDDRSRMTKIEHKDGTTVKQGFTYTLDDNSNVSKVTYDGGETWDYFYDGKNRLTKAERDDNSATLLHRYTYTYDDADNMLTKAIYDGTTTSTDILAYNTANELTKQTNDSDVTDFTYDAWGRMVTKAQDTTYEATYAYRYGDKLYSVTSDFPSEGTVTYDYGDDGQRKSRTVGASTTNYYNDGWNVINEKTGSAWTTYTFDKRAPVGNILSQVDGDPATGSYEYFAHDNLGSTRSLYNQSKTEVANYEYTPYGDNYASSGSASTNYRFTGKHWDATSGLYHFPFRYYAPDQTRWIARDPLGMMDGPNVYAYTVDNPTSVVDPLGGHADFTACFWMACVCAIAARACQTAPNWLTCLGAAVACGAYATTCLSGIFEPYDGPPRGEHPPPMYPNPPLPSL